jgi:hypothetical protein
VRDAFPRQRVWQCSGTAFLAYPVDAPWPLRQIEQKFPHGKSLLKTVLQQKLSKALVAELQSLWWPEQGNTPLAEFNEKTSRLSAPNSMPGF